MRFLVSGVIAVTMAVWVVAIALLSIQNVLITDDTGNRAFITLKFLGLTSVPLPFGLTLSFSVALGMVAAAILLPLWAWTPKLPGGWQTRSPRSPKRRP